MRQLRVAIFFFIVFGGILGLFRIRRLLDLVLCELVFLFSPDNEIKDLAFVKEHLDNLKISFSIYVQEIKHHVLLSDAVHNLVYVAVPSFLRDVTRWEVPSI